MTKQAEQTEVVKIRLGSSEKAALEAIAERECRTFAAQVRLAVREALEWGGLGKITFNKGY